MLHSSPWGWTQIEKDELERLQKIEKMFWVLKSEEPKIFEEQFTYTELEEVKQ